MLCLSLQGLAHDSKFFPWLSKAELSKEHSVEVVEGNAELEELANGRQFQQFSHCRPRSFSISFRAGYDDGLKERELSRKFWPMVDEVKNKRACPLRGKPDAESGTTCSKAGSNNANIACHIRRGHLLQALLCGFCRKYGHYNTDPQHVHSESQCALAATRVALGRMALDYARKRGWLQAKGNKLNEAGLEAYRKHFP